MSHRLKNEHRSRHHTHATKPANLSIGPLGQINKIAPAPLLVHAVPEEIAIPAVAEVVAA
jgi:hypothetical protein